jgi:tetratricopeptide (TPR) repeat protein
MNHKQYDSARFYFNKAIHIDPAFTAAFYNLGFLYATEKQFDLSKEYYYKAVRIDPGYTNAYVGLGNMFVREQIFDSAKIYYQKAINSNPKNPDAYYNLGFLYFTQKQFDSAKHYYYESIIVDRGYASAYNGLGNAFMNEQILDSAKFYYHKAISTDPKYTEAYYNLGFLFLNQNQYDSAKYYINETIDINPKYAFGYLGRGNIFFKQKQYDSAMLNYRTAIALDSLNLNAYTFLSACLAFKNEPDSSAYILKQITDHKIADVSTYRIGAVISNYYQNKKLFNKETEIARLLYNYDSVYHVPGLDSSQKRNLLNNLAFAYLNTGSASLSKFYYEKSGAVSYFYYNAACLASLDKKTKEALQNLEISFQKGYADYEHIQQDTDLDNLRNIDEFKQLLKKYFPGKAK